MAEPLRSTVGQFSSAGGRWQPRGQNMRAVEPAPDHPRAERGSLYILIEVTGAGGGHAALYRQLLTAAQVAFYEVGDTVEVALRQAVREVQAVLRRANEALPEAAWRAGLSMVVRYGPHLVIGQAGPSLVLVSHPKTVDVFPARLGDSGPALGGPDRPEVVIYDATVEAGSMVLMAQSDWAEQAKLEALAVAAASPSVSQATQYLGQLAGSADLSALLISFDYDIPSVKDAGAGVRPLEGGATGITGEAESPAAESARPQGKGLFGGLFGRGRTPERVEPEEVEAAPLDLEPEPELPEEPEVVAPIVTKPAPWPPSHGVRSESEPAPSLAEQRAAAEAENRQRAAWEQRIAAEAEAGVATEEIALEPEPFEPSAPPRRSAWPLVLALIFIPLLILAVVVGMLLTRTRAADAQFTEVLAGANNVITQAEQSTDDAAAAQRLAGAKEFLDQAKALRPNDEQLGEMLNRYENLVMRVEKVTPLYGIVPLWPFQGDTGHQLERVMATGESVFVLDKATNQVNRFTRSALGDSVEPVGDKPAVQKGDPVGDHTVGDLIDMVWIEAATANQRSLLHVFDAAGELVAFDEVYGQKRLIVDRAKWVTPQLIAGYNGNLYVADPGADQIWRYAPTANGYEGEPTPWFQEDKKPDMAGMVALAIDGHIWLLHSDGRLLKFLSGEQRAFAWDGLPSPFSSPSALALSQEGDRLYVADPGNSRIVEATKDGKFLRQFKAREGTLLSGIRHLFLDESKGIFYIVTADQLYKASIPQAAPAQ